MLCSIAACVAAILCLLITSCASQASVRVIRATAHTATGTAAPARARLQACSRSPVPGFSCTHPAVTVTPSGRLRTGQRVMVRVTGFAIGIPLRVRCQRGRERRRVRTSAGRAASSRNGQQPLGFRHIHRLQPRCGRAELLGANPRMRGSLRGRRDPGPGACSRLRLRSHYLRCLRRAHSAHAEGLSAASYLSACGSPLPMPSRAAIASAGSVRLAAATFSRRCASDEVPGISAIVAERCSSHASAT